MHRCTTIVNLKQRLLQDNYCSLGIYSFFSLYFNFSVFFYHTVGIDTSPLIRNNTFAIKIFIPQLPHMAQKTVTPLNMWIGEEQEKFFKLLFLSKMLESETVIQENGVKDR